MSATESMLHRFDREIDAYMGVSSLAKFFISERLVPQMLRDELKTNADIEAALSRFREQEVLIQNEDRYNRFVDSVKHISICCRENDPTCSGHLNNLTKTTLDRLYLYFLENHTLEKTIQFLSQSKPLIIH